MYLFNRRSPFKNLRLLQPRSTPNSSSECFSSCDFHATILGNKGEGTKTNVPSKSNDGESAKLSPSFAGTVESWGRGEIFGWLKRARLMRQILAAEVRSSRATSESNKRPSLRRIDSSFFSLKSLPVIIRGSNERCVAQTQTELDSLPLPLSEESLWNYTRHVIPLFSNSWRSGSSLLTRLKPTAARSITRINVFLFRRVVESTEKG